MKLKQQITLLISLALVVPAVLIGSVSIYNIQKKAKADIAEYQTEEFAKLKIYLKHITDVAYGIIETEHREIQKTALADSVQISDIQRMENCLAQLAQIRFDNGEGYFWVTDNKLPYPTMVMHAEKSNLKGHVLDDPKYNLEKTHGRNIYQIRAELANANGDAYVEYVMKKPGTEEVDNKISYSRLYKPLGWIISTGFYTDQIEKTVIQRKEALTKQIRRMIFFIVGLGVLVMGIGLSLSIYFSKELTNAIVLVKERLKDLAEGRLVEQVTSKRKDEVGDMAQSLNSLVDGFKTYSSFAKEIGNGNFSQTFKPLSEEDVLGNELLVMRDNLKKAEIEKNVRDWSNEGLARLSEVMRRSNNDMRILADGVLKELVKYTKVNQGALFIVTDTSQNVLELVAAYAYDRKKFIEKKIEFGEGLAGQCVLERRTIHLREVPENYVQITSGLGRSLPRTVIVVPLVHDEKVYGVLEMASFKTFEAHEVSFVEKIAESMASTISAVQVNENTKILLEQSQQMSEEMKAQEEEVRQNMEELSATQEQMARQLEDNKKLQQNLQIHEEAYSVNNLLSESDLQGIILMVNDKLCQVSKYERDELLGQSHKIFRHADMPKEFFAILWERIKSGKRFKGIIKNRKKDGSHYWIDATIVPVKDESGVIVKYVGVGYHLTNEDIAIELYNRQASIMNFPLLAQTFSPADSRLQV